MAQADALALASVEAANGKHGRRPRAVHPVRRVEAGEDALAARRDRSRRHSRCCRNAAAVEPAEDQGRRPVVEEVGSAQSRAPGPRRRSELAKASGSLAVSGVWDRCREPESLASGVASDRDGDSCREQVRGQRF